MSLRVLLRYCAKYQPVSIYLPGNVLVVDYVLPSEVPVPFLSRDVRCFYQCDDQICIIVEEA